MTLEWNRAIVNVIDNTVSKFDEISALNRPRLIIVGQGVTSGTDMQRIDSSYSCIV